MVVKHYEATLWLFSDLKNACEWSLASRLTIENTIDTWIVAERYDAEILKTATFDLFRKY